MEKDFILYEQALELKELEFDEPCMASWTYTYELQQHVEFKLGYIIDGPRNYTNAPTYSQAFRFFREKYKLDGIAFWNYTGYMWNIIDIEKSNKITNITIQDDDMEEYVTKEKSELECLKKLIKIVKEK